MKAAEILSRFLHVDNETAKIIGGGLIVLATAATIMAWQINIADLHRVAVVVVGYSVLAMMLARASGILATCVAWLATAVLAVYCLLFVTQFVTNSRYTPPIMQAGCFLSPTDPDCPLYPRARLAMMAEQAAGAPPVPAPAPIVTAENQPTRGWTPAAEDPAAGDGRALRILFAGRVAPAVANALAADLAATGWDIPEDRGVQRVSSAFGLNELRYFRPADAEAAAALAAELNASGIAGPVALVDRSAGTEDRPLELWISNR
jgi:hypothetical protein